MQMFVPIIMYGLGLFFVVKTESTMFTNFEYDVAHHSNELHISAKFNGLSVIELCLCNEKIKEEDEGEF